MIHNIFHSTFFWKSKIKTRMIFQISFPLGKETFLWFNLPKFCQLKMFHSPYNLANEKRCYLCLHKGHFLYRLGDYWDSRLIFLSNTSRLILPNLQFRNKAFYQRKWHQYIHTLHSWKASKLFVSILGFFEYFLDYIAYLNFWSLSLKSRTRVEF